MSIRSVQLYYLVMSAESLHQFIDIASKVKTAEKRYKESASLVKPVVYASDQVLRSTCDGTNFCSHDRLNSNETSAVDSFVSRTPDSFQMPSEINCLALDKPVVTQRTSTQDMDDLSSSTDNNCYDENASSSTKTAVQNQSDCNVIDYQLSYNEQQDQSNTCTASDTHAQNVVSSQCSTNVSCQRIEALANNPVCIAEHTKFRSALCNVPDRYRSRGL